MKEKLIWSRALPNQALSTFKSGFDERKCIFSLLYLQVSIDNCTTPSYSVVNIVCNDRKGLVYDLMRTMKDIQIRVAYAKVNVRPGGLCEIDIFVQELDGSRILDK